MMGMPIDQRLKEVRARILAETISEMDELRERLSGIQDDRGAAVLSHLLVMRCVDDLISVILPRYAIRLAGQEEAWRESSLTDYHRLNLARAVTVADFWSVIDAVDALRRIRNEFAHRPDLRVFKDVSSGNIDRLRRALEALPESKPRDSNPTVDALYSRVLFDTLIELRLACARLKNHEPLLTDLNEMFGSIPGRDDSKDERK